jgi:hypothetical protein
VPDTVFTFESGIPTGFDAFNCLLVAPTLGEPQSQVLQFDQESESWSLYVYPPIIGLGLPIQVHYAYTYAGDAGLIVTGYEDAGEVQISRYSHELAVTETPLVEVASFDVYGGGLAFYFAGSRSGYTVTAMTLEIFKIVIPGPYDPIPVRPILGKRSSRGAFL